MTVPKGRYLLSKKLSSATPSQYRSTIKYPLFVREEDRPYRATPQKRESTGVHESDTDIRGGVWIPLHRVRGAPK